MTRVASQFTFCSPLQILRLTVVEQDEQNRITRLFSLDDNAVESAQTLFFDGILSRGFVSLKENKYPETTGLLLADYLYVDFSSVLPVTKIMPTDKPLLLDFGTSSPDEINRKLEILAPALTLFSVFDIIAACVYYPLLVLGEQAILSEKCRTGLIIWEHLDLVNKRVAVHTRIRRIN